MTTGISGIRTDIPIGIDPKTKKPIYMSDILAPQPLEQKYTDLAKASDLRAAVDKAVASGDNAAVQSAANARDSLLASSGNTNLMSSQDYLKSQNYVPTAASPASVAPNSTATMQKPEFDIQGTINRLKDAQLSATMAGLGKARDTSISNLNSEQAKLQPMYYDKRNAATSQNNMGRRTLAEELARRGETNSGVADQANISANMSLQGDIGGLRRQEAADNVDINRRISDTNNAYESDVAAAKANIEAQALNNLIQQMNADRAFNLQEAGVTGKYNGNSTLEAMNADRNYGLNLAGLTGNINGQSTLEKQKLDSSNEQWKQSFDESKKQSFINNFGYDPTDANKTKTLTADTAGFNKAMNIWQTTGSVTGELAKSLGLDSTKTYTTLEANNQAFSQAIARSNQTGTITGNDAKILGVKDGTPTYQAKMNAEDNAWKELSAFGKIGDAKTAALIGVPANTSTLAAQSQIINNRINAAQAYIVEAEKNTIDETQKTKLAVLKQQLLQATEEAKAAQYENNPKVRQAKLDQIKAQTDNIGASVALGREQLAWDKDPTNPKNIKPNTATTNTVDDYANTINSLYVTKADQDKGTAASIDTDGVKSYLSALQTAGVDETTLKQLAARYGIIAK